MPTIYVLISNFITIIFIQASILKWEPKRHKGTLSYYQSQADIGFRATLNTAPGTNTFVFGILMILMQIAIVLIYAFLVWVPSYDYSDPVGSVNFTPIVTTVLLFLMVVVGNDSYKLRLRSTLCLYKKISLVSTWI